jgi:uncharacterized membrane protein YgcG
MNPTDATASAFCSNLHDLLMPWAFVITVAGFIWSFKDILSHPHSKPEKAMVLILEVCIIAALLAGWKALFFTWLEGTVGTVASQAGDANQFTFMTQVVAKSGQSEQSFFTFDWSRVLYLAVAYGFMKVVTWIAIAVQWVMDVFRVFFINCMYAISPLFVPMIIFQPLSSRGSNFIITAASLHFWKIGFVLVDIGSYAMFENAQTGINNSVDSVATVFPIFLAAGWIIIGYLGTPFAIRAIAQVGASVAGAMVESGPNLLGQTGLRYAGGNLFRPQNSGSSSSSSGSSSTSSNGAASGTGEGSGASRPASPPAPSIPSRISPVPADRVSEGEEGVGPTASTTGAAQTVIAQTQAKIDQIMVQGSGASSTGTSNAPATPPSSSASDA